MSESNGERLLVYDKSGELRDLNDFRNDNRMTHLYFKPELVNALFAELEARIRWDARYTGEISFLPDSSISFVTNDTTGVINAIAKDIAMLPYEAQRIWVSYNCQQGDEAPENLNIGHLQGDCDNTNAPETLFFDELMRIHYVFRNKFGALLFREHNDLEFFTRKIHRFRAVENDGLWPLTKDIVKASIKRIDKQSLIHALGEVKEGIEPLELLEELFLKYTGKKEQIVPLSVLDNQGQVDALLSSSDIEDFYECFRIDRQNSPVSQSVDLLQSVADAFKVIADDLEQHGQIVD